MIHQSSLLVVFLWIFLRHPFFVSVCDIEYRPKQESLQITHKIFWDDLESAFKKEYKQSFDLLHVKDTTAFNQQLDTYIQKNFQVKINDKALNLKFVGWEIEGDALWCYQEATKVKKFSSIVVKSSVLMDLHSEQTNLVHVKKDGETKSLRLEKGSETGSLGF